MAISYYYAMSSINELIENCKNEILKDNSNAIIVEAGIEIGDTSRIVIYYYKENGNYCHTYTMSI
jgi:hypothetical protein